MATSVNVGITISSNIGFRRPSYAVTPPLPHLQTVYSLEGETFTNTGITLNSPVLIIDPLEYFYLVPERTSNTQTVVLRNFGNSTLTISAITFSANGVESVHSNLTYPISISSGTSSTFSLAYTAPNPGDFENYFEIRSNLAVLYKVSTRQIVDDTFYFDVVPSSLNDSIDEIGERSYNSFTFNVDRGAISTLSASVTPGTGYRVASADTSTVSIFFDADYVDNINGVYTGTLTISANEITRNVPLTTTVAIDASKYKNLVTWTSPAAYNNSIVGISLDYINTTTIPTLTIGVGLGADGAPIYANGGSTFGNLKSLGISAANLDTPYPYWANVYRIPLVEANRVYLSGELDDNDLPRFVAKTTEGLNYADYFGFEQSQGSIFIVQRDDLGNITIEINNLRELSGDDDFDATLQNITRAFHYYSSVDNVQRYYQLESAPADNLPVTHLFRGFNAYFDPDKKWSVEVTTVPLPR